MELKKEELDREELYQELLDTVTKEFIDFAHYRQERDGTDELLGFIPVDMLIGFLNEEDWEKYESLLRGRKMYENPKRFDE
jgi:hypothetical protein